MFHVKHLDGPVAAQHFGQARESDWRVERRPDGTFYWTVADWTGEYVASGVRVTLGEAVTEAVKWST